jgi:curved DNA-binding protein CbpA
VIDFFALLGEPRRPWLDPDALKQKFLALTAGSHPDRVHSGTETEKHDAQQQYTELNAAYNCLRDPKERLRHLLELETGAKPEQVQTIPTGLMDTFLEVGRVCREADVFLAQKAQVSSPLLKVQMFERGQEFDEKLRPLQQTLISKQEELSNELKLLDNAWISDPSQHSAMLKRLEELHRLFAYFARWRAQIQERIVRLVE